MAALFAEQARIDGRKKERTMTPRKIEAAVKIDGFKVKEEGGEIIASFKSKSKTLTISSKRETVEGCFGWIADVMNGRA